MSENEIIAFAREAIMLTIMIATPVMLVGLVVGVTISLVQALTQIQEMTLTFVPKIIAIFATIFILFPVMVVTMSTFMEKISQQIIGIN